MCKVGFGFCEYNGYWVWWELCIVFNRYGANWVGWVMGRVGIGCGGYLVCWLWWILSMVGIGYGEYWVWWV